MVVAVLFNAGDQTPDMPLLETVGSGLSADPEQMEATGVKVGTVKGLTVIVSVAVEAH